MLWSYHSDSSLLVGKHEPNPRVVFITPLQMQTITYVSSKLNSILNCFFCHLLNKQYFSSGIHASLALMLHCHYFKESLHVNFSRKALQYIGDFGIIGFVSGTALTLFYLFLEIYYKAGKLSKRYLNLSC